MKIRLVVLVTLLLALLLATPALAGPAAPEARKIEALIASVEQLPDAVFIRNGKEHGAADAADHLRLKLRHAGRRVRTAEDFIECCASASSMTGRKYQIRFADGRTVDAGDYFRERLRRLEATGSRRSLVPPAKMPATR